LEECTGQGPAPPPRVAGEWRNVATSRDARWSSCGPTRPCASWLEQSEQAARRIRSSLRRLLVVPLAEGVGWRWGGGGVREGGSGCAGWRPGGVGFVGGAVFIWFSRRIWTVQSRDRRSLAVGWWWAG
jgi:hypothetical protein